MVNKLPFSSLVIKLSPGLLVKKAIMAFPRLTALAVACAFSTVALAAEDYVAPRTQWGQPDLQGVWNFSSNTPMQRPSRFGDRQFLTPEEVREIAEQRAARDASNDGAIAVEGVDGSYNDFWVENAGIGGDVRTSHIVYPVNGKLPALREGAIASQGVYGGDTTGESRPVRISAGGIGTDGPGGSRTLRALPDWLQCGASLCAELCTTTMCKSSRRKIRQSSSQK